MSLEEIKAEMKEYRDIFGNKFLRYAEIDACKNMVDCESIIEHHRNFLEAQVSDASLHLDRLREKCGIN